MLYLASLELLSNWEWVHCGHLHPFCLAPPNPHLWLPPVCSPEDITESVEKKNILRDTQDRGEKEDREKCLRECPYLEEVHKEGSKRLEKQERAAVRKLREKRVCKKILDLVGPSYC